MEEIAEILRGVDEQLVHRVSGILEEYLSLHISLLNAYLDRDVSPRLALELSAREARRSLMPRLEELARDRRARAALVALHNFLDIVCALLMWRR